MKLIKSIDSSEMVGEFLKAELEYSRFKNGSLKALKMLGYNEEIISHPDYSSSEENKKRAKVLGLTRGWPDQWLFDSFPENTRWLRICIEQTELAKSYRLKSKPDMTKNERHLSNTAQAVRDNQVIRNIDPALVSQIKESVVQGQILPPIILVSSSLDAEKVLVEGHSRSIAYCLVEHKYVSKGIPAILGISPSITRWRYY